MARVSHLWVPYILYLLFRFAQYISEVPTVRMIEYAACHRLSDRAMIGAVLDESDCKTTAIQDTISWVMGWKMSFDAAPGTSLSPFSALCLYPPRFADLCALVTTDG